MQNRGAFNTFRLIPRDTQFLDRLQGSRGEIYYDKQTNSLRLFDSQTTGGYELTKNDLSNVTNATFLQKAQAAGVGGSGSSFEILVAADDSTARTVSSGNILQFSGGGGISTSSTVDGEIVITSNVNTFSTIAVAGQTNVVADSSTDTLTLIAGTNVTITTNASNDSITIAAAAGASTNSFSTISIAGQNSVVADSGTDTLTLVAGTGITITTDETNDTITITNSSLANSFSTLTEVTTSSLSIDKIYLPAITMLTVTNSGAIAYRFDQYGSSNNPTIYAINGTTIAFNLQATGHPFQIQTAAGSNYNTGLTHVTTSGTVTTESAAQSKDSGTLYWKIPSDISGNYRYQCGSHGAMVGTITIKNFGSI